MHLPLLQGEPPVLAIIRREEQGKLLAIKLGEPRGRDFHKQVMGYCAQLASEIAAIDRTPFILAHVLFTGHMFTPKEIHGLMADRWPSEAYSVLTMTHGGGSGKLYPTEGEGWPLNHFSVPRLALISSLNFAYMQPGMLQVALNEQEAGRLAGQMAAFAERANKVSTTDPEAVLEHVGEGRVIALAAAVWYAFRASEALQVWGRERLASG